MPTNIPDDILALLDDRPAATPAPAPAPPAAPGSILSFMVPPPTTTNPAPTPDSTKFPARGLVFDEATQAWTPEPKQTPPTSTEPREIRRILTERMAHAPHAADTFPVTKKPDHFDLRCALADFPKVTFHIGPTTYTVRDAWETYDLMRRNLTPPTYKGKNCAGRELRVCPKRWKQRRDKRLAKSA